MEFPIQELNSIFRFFHSILFIQFHSVYSIPFLEMATNLETSCNSKSRDMWSLLFIGFFSIQSDNFWEREIDSCTNMDKKKSSGAGQFLLKLPQTEWNGIYSIRNAIDSIRIFGPAHDHLWPKLTWHLVTFLSKNLSNCLLFRLKWHR